MHTQVRDEPFMRAQTMIDNWLSGNRSRGTHSDLCIALRATLGIDLSNQEINEIIRRAEDRDLGAEAILSQLLGRDTVDERRSQHVAKPR